MITAGEFGRLHTLMFSDSWPGYKPRIQESSNGDGVWDTKKRYSHLKEEYLLDYPTQELGIGEAQEVLKRCYEKSVEVAIFMGIPRKFWPDPRRGALRLIEYGPSASTAPHKDFSLFTLMVHRNIPECFRYLGVGRQGMSTQITAAQEFNKQIHFGEIMELVNPLFPATIHEVIPDSYNRVQYSAVYFAIPPWESELPDGRTVGQFIEERLARSRRGGDYA